MYYLCNPRCAEGRFDQDFLLRVSYLGEKLEIGLILNQNLYHHHIMKIALCVCLSGHRPFAILLFCIDVCVPLFIDNVFNVR